MKKNPLSPEDVTQLFSEIDASGVLDPSLTADQRAAKAAKVDPLSDDDPSGSQVGHTITKTAIAIVIIMILAIVGMQIGYGVIRRLNTANLSDNVTVDSVSTALEGGVEWGSGFTQFPRTFTVDEADERTGTVEVTVVDTDASSELELLSNGQIQAAALATNALLNDKIDRVVYNVCAYVDSDSNIQHDSFFGLVAASGTQRNILTFVWTKPTQGDSSNIDWQLRIVSMDEEITERIQKQVNSVSSLIDTPAVSENRYAEEKAENSLAHDLRAGQTLTGGSLSKKPSDVVPSTDE